MSQTEEYNIAFTIIRDAEERIRRETALIVRLKMEDITTHDFTPRQLLERVAITLGMRYDQYKVRSREIRYKYLRFCGYMMLKKYFPKLDLKTMGDFCNQDHSTVINAMNASQNLIDTEDAEFCEKFNKVQMNIDKWLYNEQTPV